MTFSAGFMVALTLWRWWIKFIFRNGWVHLIPWLCVRHEEIHLRSKPTWIVETACCDPDKFGRPVVGLPACQSRAAFGAKTAFVFAAGHARREVVAQLPLRQA